MGQGGEVVFLRVLDDEECALLYKARVEYRRGYVAEAGKIVRRVGEYDIVGLRCGSDEAQGIGAQQCEVVDIEPAVPRGV